MHENKNAIDTRPSAIYTHTCTQANGESIQIPEKTLFRMRKISPNSYQQYGNDRHYNTKLVLQHI
jgi:hypothetical protein